ncbi:ethanolamine permease [Enterobacter cloacae]|uniref:ethanolamine permease n=1 Tax=Enterobacter cloacae TaxID=550 RepID=UPI0032DA1048
MTKKLERSLNTFQLWGIAVGLVISGEYFGWSYGWGVAGTLGFFYTTGFVAVMYLCFIFSLTELTVSMPNSGGPFSYSEFAFGKIGATITGVATLIEFIFAPPAIAMAIGSYVTALHPQVDKQSIAIGCYIVFMWLNYSGVNVTARVELAITILALLELILFMGLTSSGFSLRNLTTGGWAGNDTFFLDCIPKMFSAIPFAIWFFLAIEGVAMAAEEVRNPKKSIPIAYFTGIATLLVLAFGVMIFAGGAGNWKELANVNDPLPLALKMVIGGNHLLIQMLVGIGVFGLIASFNGIILAYSRQIFSLSREGYLPSVFSELSRNKTPHIAILTGGFIGIIGILADKVNFMDMSTTAIMITIAVFGALTMYIMSMLSLFRIRGLKLASESFYKVPGYPVIPGIAFSFSFISLVSMVWFYPSVFILFIVCMLVGSSFVLVKNVNSGR